MNGRSCLTTRMLYAYNTSMRKVFKFRLYPNKQQQRLLNQQLEECRWLNNELLTARRDAWEQRQESLRL
jgi:putative transposase